jgi:hypothetical protein
MSEKELLDAIAAEPFPQKPVDTITIRRKAVELRDFYLQKAELENRIKEVSRKITDVERHELIDMFDNAGISGIDVDADGNHPAFRAERSTVYGAKIPDERRLEALQWFEQTGHGDLVKSVITIQFGMQEHEERLRVMKILSNNGVEYYTNESVHHMTLKAFIKGELQKSHVIPMDLLGAYVFDEVKIK